MADGLMQLAVTKPQVRQGGSDRVVEQSVMLKQILCQDRSI